MDDFETQAAFIEANSFATLVTAGGEAQNQLFATHLPLLFNRTRGEWGALAGHVALGNEQWKHLRDMQARGGEAMAIFHGPHAYISPSWYETELAVPTWNYVAVHAYGTPRLLDDAELAAQLRAMIEKYESARPAPWPGALPEEFEAKLRKGIVGFEIEITRLEGKRKLSQNRPASDQANVIAALQDSPLEDDREIARLMSKP